VAFTLSCRSAFTDKKDYQPEKGKIKCHRQHKPVDSVEGPEKRKNA
jgi:hypothetical protein